MIKILNKLISKIKKEHYELNENITFAYIFHICAIRLFQVIRGFVRLHRFPIFIGKGVSIKGKSFLKVGNGTTLDNNVDIDAFSKNGVVLGNNVKIGANTIICGSGSLKVSGKGLKMGNNSSVGEYSYFGSAGGISVGDDVMMGQNVRFHAQNHHFNELDKNIRDQGVYQKGIAIGNDCWIGSGVVFLDGVNVGSGVVIGANTLVNKDIPSNSIAVGNPVKIIKKRGK